MNVKDIGPEQVQNILINDDCVIYIDIRTEQEFETGHVPGAINIPVEYPAPSTHQMKLNPVFVEVVSANIAKNTPIVVGCQTGSRSSFAAELLIKAGFKKVMNMIGGFDGSCDVLGRPLAPGWRQHGFAIETDVIPHATYRWLKQAADDEA